jgi:Ca2+-dependent lipid-binding protein
MSDVNSVFAAACVNLGSIFCGNDDRGGILTDSNHDVRAAVNNEGQEKDQQKSSRSPRWSVASATNEHQSGEMLTDILAQLWPLVSTVLAMKIKERVEPRFATLPGVLSSLHFVTVDLGHVPMRLDNVVVHELETDPSRMLQIDMDLHWDGNCDIQLKANVLGQLGVTNIKVFGRLSILLKPLHANLPIVQSIQIAFINTPQISLEFTGLANIADVEMIRQRIYTLVQKIVQKQMVVPQRRLIKLDMACRFFDIYQPPLGVARLLIKSGKGFVVEDRGVFQKPDIPDCFLVCSLGDTEHKTSTVKDDLSPTWNEKMDYLFCDFDQIIHMDVYDEDAGPLDPDDYLGSADVTVGEILLEGGSMELSLHETGGKLTGAKVAVACSHLSLVEELDSLSTSSQTASTSSNEIFGLLTVLIGQAFRLPCEKEDVAACVEISCGDQIYTTKIVKDYPGLDSLNPFFDGAFHFPLTTSLLDDGRVKDITLTLVNQKVRLGKIRISHADLAGATGHSISMKQPVENLGAAIEYCISLKGVVGTGAADTLSSVPSKGSKSIRNRSIVRITLVKAHGFRTQRFRRFLRKKRDIADPYCIIRYGSSPSPWRSKTIKNNLSPTWGEQKDFLFLNHGQILNIDVFDDNSGRNRKDDLLGTARVTVGKIFLAGGSMDIEIKLHERATGIFVSIRCELQ